MRYLDATSEVLLTLRIPRCRVPFLDVCLQKVDEPQLYNRRGEKYQSRIIPQSILQRLPTHSRENHASTARQVRERTVLPIDQERPRVTALPRTRDRQLTQTTPIQRPTGPQTNHILPAPALKRTVEGTVEEDFQIPPVVGHDILDHLLRPAIVVREVGRNEAEHPVRGRAPEEGCSGQLGGADVGGRVAIDARVEIARFEGVEGWVFRCVRQCIRLDPTGPFVAAQEFREDVVMESAAEIGGPVRDRE